jgi:hypothetical protein
MKYKIVYLQNKKKNKIIQTLILTNIKSNPEQMFQIESINLSIDDMIINNSLQNLILDSYLYLGKNNLVIDLETNLKELDNITNVVSNHFCQIPLSLIDNYVIKKDNGISDVCFKFDWNNFFSQPLVLTNEYIIIIKINTCIPNDKIINYDINIDYKKCTSYEGYLKYPNSTFINFFQSTSIANIYFEEFINKYNKENKLTEFINKFKVRKECNLKGDSRGFVIQIHKFTYDKLETIQIFYNGLIRCCKILKNDFEFYYCKKTILNSDHFLLYIPLNFYEKDYKLDPTYEKNLNKSPECLSKFDIFEIEFIFKDSKIYTNQIKIISIDLFTITYYASNELKISTYLSRCIKKNYNEHDIIKIFHSYEPFEYKLKKINNYSYEHDSLERNSDVCVLNFLKIELENNFDLNNTLNYQTDDLVEYILESNFEIYSKQLLLLSFPLYLCKYKLYNNTFYIDLVSNKYFDLKFNIISMYFCELTIKLVFIPNTYLYNQINNVVLRNLNIFVETNFRKLLISYGKFNYKKTNYLEKILFNHIIVIKISNKTKILLYFL